MPYKTDWYVEHRVLRLKVFGETTQQEFMDSTTQVVEIMRPYRTPLIFILDFREIGKIAFSVNTLKALTLFRPRELPIEWMIVISNNAVYSFFGTLAGKITAFPVAVFKTLDEANAFIQRHVPEIVLPQVTR